MELCHFVPCFVIQTKVSLLFIHFFLFSFFLMQLQFSAKGKYQTPQVLTQGRKEKNPPKLRAV